MEILERTQILYLVEPIVGSKIKTLTQIGLDIVTYLTVKDGMMPSYRVSRNLLELP